MRPLREEQQDLRKAPETANLTRHRAYLTWRHVLAAYGFTLIVLSAERYVNSAYSTTPLISSIRVCFAQLILIAAAAGLSLKCRGCFAIGSPVTAFRSHPLLLGVASLVAAVRGVPHIAALQVYWGSFSIVASKLSASVILVPLAEEWIFRGVIQTALRRSLPGFWWLGFRLEVATVLAAGLFGSIHFLQLLNHKSLGNTLTMVGSAFAFGLVAGYFYQRTRNLWVPTLLHMFGNLAGF